MNFNEKLIRLRKSKGLSQEELPFLSVVLDLETTPPAIVGVSVGLFFLFAGFSIKLAAWKQVNDKTVKNSGIGFTSVLIILFAAMKLTGYTDWRWI